jgi:hypothetical protein
MIRKRDESPLPLVQWQGVDRKGVVARMTCSGMDGYPRLRWWSSRAMGRVSAASSDDRQRPSRRPFAATSYTTCSLLLRVWLNGLGERPPLVV